MEQNTQEWLDFRKDKIGASDASAIMGINPWKTRYQLWEEKVYGKEQSKTIAMQRGSFYESEARSEFEKMTGIPMMPKVIVNPKRRWQMASLDGISIDGTIFTEIKVPNRQTHELAKKGVVAEHYNIQMQHQYATDPKLEKGLYFSYCPDLKEGVLVEVKKDNLLIEEILEEEERFYECIKTKTAPELCEKDYVWREDLEWSDLAREWSELSRYIKNLQENEEELREKLISMTKGQNTRGAGVRLTRSICKGPVDYKKIPELRDLDLDLYRKGSFEKWTLSACK